MRSLIYSTVGLLFLIPPNNFDKLPSQEEIVRAECTERYDRDLENIPKGVGLEKRQKLFVAVVHKFWGCTGDNVHIPFRASVFSAAQ